jgi:hypothetical protein
MPDIEIHYSEEWAALYVDGRLERVGDSYLAEERALQILGVTTVQDDAFMRGQNQAAGVAQTLNEVSDYRIERDRRATEAADLRRRAAELLAEANRVDPQAADR